MGGGGAGGVCGREREGVGVGRGGRRGEEEGKLPLLSLSLLEFRAETKLTTLPPEFKVLFLDEKLNFKLCPKRLKFSFRVENKI